MSDRNVIRRAAQRTRIRIRTVGGGSGGGGVTVHNLLSGRSAADAHPISAISELQEALDAKAALDDISDVGLSGEYQDLINPPDIAAAIADYFDENPNNSFILTESYAGLQSQPERPDGDVAFVREDETHEGLPAFYQVEDGVWYFWMSLSGTDSPGIVAALVCAVGVNIDTSAPYPGWDDPDLSIDSEGDAAVLLASQTDPAEDGLYSIDAAGNLTRMSTQPPLGAAVTVSFVTGASALSVSGGITIFWRATGEGTLPAGKWWRASTSDAYRLLGVQEVDETSNSEWPGLPAGDTSLMGFMRTVADNWPTLGGGAVDSVNGETGVVVLDAADVGALPDTTDFGTAAFLDRGAASGVASLDGSATVPDSQIPSSIARDTEVAAAVIAHDGSGTAHSALFAAKATIVNTDGDPGTTIYVGSIDPDVAHTLAAGDVWIEVP